MNKKVALSIILLSAGSFFFSSCKKEGCTDSDAINYDEDAKKDDGSCEYEEEEEDLSVNSALQYSFELDGQVQSGDIDANTEAVVGSSTASGSPSGTVYESSFFDNGTPKDIIVISKGVMASSSPTDSEFSTFFDEGSYSYANVNNGGESGVQVRIQTSNGTTYSSYNGDQTGSTFKIVEAKDDYFGAALYVKTYITFSCEVYNVNNPSDSKTITNGVFINHFYKF